MTAKEYLDRARTLDREIKSKKRELAKIKADSRCLNSPVLGDKVISSHTNNSNSASDKAMDLEKTINSEISKLIDLQTEIHAKIVKLPKAEHRIVLTDYYINCNTLEEIAENNNCDVSHVKRLKKIAVETFAKNLGFKMSQNELL